MCDRTILCISGPDAKSFLQNLVTNDVAKLKNNIIYAALLTPQGKLFSDFFLIDSKQGVLIDVHSNLGDSLLKTLNLYKLRAEIKIEKTDLKVSTGVDNKPPKAFDDPRNPNMGWRYYGSEDLRQKNIDWEKLRVQNLVPEFGKELSSDSYILEYGFERLNGVDFKKGCYVGQEVTARMKHKSKLRKGLTIVETAEKVPFDTPISVNDKMIGKVLSSSDNRALAYLRFDFACQNMMAGKVKITYHANRSFE
ncbi:MAG: folate-binding protein YgfZ [Rhodobacteraceae bacterium TMED111]|nr:folate-binding protein YgfZ [Marinovum sp.]OUV39246.1 MAG: folate-binding protein YgfZ [Rhodobacteraceae bacterium TMED111]|tara:strand:+ start:8980 stop:9732 length:753 start_codon:yes stop_codon:yes gene_type:complete